MLYWGCSGCFLLYSSLHGTSTRVLSVESAQSGNVLAMSLTVADTAFLSDLAPPLFSGKQVTGLGLHCIEGKDAQCESALIRVYSHACHTIVGLHLGYDC